MTPPAEPPSGTNPLPKRAVVYVRTLTVAADIKTELQPLREEATRRGWQIQREFHDVAHIGKHKLWRGLDALTVAAKNRKFDVLVIRTLAAIGKSLPQLIRIITELFTFDIDIVAVEDGIDTVSQGKDHLIAFLNALAKADDALNGEKAKAAFELYRQAGGRLGRPPRHDRVKILQLHADGKSRQEICEILGIHAAALRYYLEPAQKKRAN